MQKELILALAGLFLLLFGIGYNSLVWLLERHHTSVLETALLVAGGVGVTLIVSAFVIGIEAALMVLVLFASSGLPMFLGAWMRSSKQAANDREVARRIMQEVMDGKTNSGRILDAAGTDASAER